MTSSIFIERIWANLNSSNQIVAIIDDKTYYYHNLKHLVNKQILLINKISSSRIGIIIDDSIEMYSAILACWFLNKAYVPIKSEYPVNRIKEMIETAELEFMWVKDPNHFPPLEGLTFLQCVDEQNNFEIDFAPVIDVEQEAYILFTSGTSGKPKGVPISHKNLQAFFEGFFDLGYSLSERDRFLQMFDLTFDLSVMSFAIPLILGASFYPLEKSLIKPLALFNTLSNRQITFALMVPSVVNMLEPYKDEIDLYHLKYTQFCGESFKIHQLNTWIDCAPNSQIDNVYGPTEVTIYCSRYIAHPVQTEPLHRNGVVCIGKEMKNSTFFVDNQGILNLGGNQVSLGYLKADENQKSKFHHYNGIWYFVSGDLGIEFDDVFYCQGREDDQVKIQGFRVELSEIEHGFNRLHPKGKSVAVAIQENEATVIYLFIQNDLLESFNSNSLIIRLAKELPSYMVPKKIFYIDHFPLNSNGKIDKKKLIKCLK
jgi:non-ribosomal peptide synthetase component F